MSQQPITSARVIEVCAYYFGVTVEDLIGHRRYPHLIEARHVAMYLCRKWTKLSYPAIGRAFGKADHTTVIHADDKIAEQLLKDSTLRSNIADCEGFLKRQALSA